MSIFYAYIHNIQDDNTARLILTFANRTVADEWWRAISTLSPAYVKRVGPQFYTHDAGRWNVLEFFTHDRFKSISGAFRGLMFITLMHDRGGRELSIIPPQEITDHISGKWQAFAASQFKVIF
ncbi:hypothetical protein VKT23_014122 [Stygiomarasmius scandens]|uniref:PH domain-containing protein n=1 Tax=Marasmiellus scandens TaxID=2682957 RepID=A0ABR1J2M9_9AGAR